MTPHPDTSATASALLELPRPVKRLLAVLVDASLCTLAVWVALYLRLEVWLRLEGAYLWAVGISIALAIPLFIRFGLYRAIFRYAGWNATVALAQAMALYGLFYATVFTLVGIQGVPRSVGLVQPLLLLVFVGLSRLAIRLWLGGLYRHLLAEKARPGVLIYGAGEAGRQLAAALARSTEYRLVGFVDDDPRLQGRSLDGRDVHSPDHLDQVIEREGVNDVLLALPSIDPVRRRQIVDRLRAHPVHVRTLPGVSDLASGRVSLSDLRELDIEDLLGRAPVSPDPVLMGQLISGHVVAVTGAGGSIGSELCRQIVQQRPTTLLLIEQSEFALYAIHHELQALVQRSAMAGSVQLVPLLASVTDRPRMDAILQSWQPHTLYHAAAYKHVPLVEHNPVQGIRNNVWGTWCCAEAARGAGVRHFVLISTDKAVRPTNIMGASKRLAEMVLQAMDSESGAGTTRFCMVRFGNVLGSSGSVVPLFRQQIAAGGPITLTHPDITRYFMTIPEAAQLVMQAGAMATGGEVFVLDMGEPVRIMDLAQRMVELSGRTVKTPDRPDGDIAIEITGLRPGEKLFEELLIGDNPQPTSHPRIMKAHEQQLAAPILEAELEHLNAAMESGDLRTVRALLQKLVQGYQPETDIVDWLHLRAGA
ncbi:nucleoside-diphosphate sugar epimerase/dehydratase [Hydrogenophaga sp. IBVHS2]|uniref:polysaccharide biosynthesis protein n=1 Tax=Hydrogenophaga sp. IBVHS2 TaxID=1985170 RepID=UPI000A2DA550|nr:nucleoside-diphosphate sugar epimerase/dehydratase [Hydrogenophaga sp. IBVHS2]OSZ63478.1 polysaccharide biosynthesis protein [Hydrogenophaga sp. IBVHS2]